MGSRYEKRFVMKRSMKRRINVMKLSRRAVEFVQVMNEDGLVRLCKLKD